MHADVVYKCKTLSPTANARRVCRQEGGGQPGAHTDKRRRKEGVRQTYGCHRSHHDHQQQGINKKERKIKQEKKTEAVLLKRNGWQSEPVPQAGYRQRKKKVGGKKQIHIYIYMYISVVTANATSVDRSL